MRVTERNGTKRNDLALFGCVVKASSLSLLKMESWIATRKQRIECDLLQLEVKVWTDIERDQQAKVDAEETKVDELREAISRARCEFFTESSDITRVVKSAFMESKRYRYIKATRENSQQTDSDQQMTGTTGTEIRWDEVESLRQELQALKRSSALQAEHKRLTEEPRCGKSFRSLQDAYKLEEDRLVALNKKVVSLELEVQSAEYVVKAGDAVLDNFDWVAAPWDEVTAEDTTSLTAVGKSCEAHGQSGLAGTRPQAPSVTPRQRPVPPPPGPTAAVQPVLATSTEVSRPGGFGLLQPTKPARLSAASLPRFHQLSGPSLSSSSSTYRWKIESQLGSNLPRLHLNRPALPCRPAGPLPPPPGIHRGAPDGGDHRIQRSLPRAGSDDDALLLRWPSTPSQPSAPTAPSQGRFVPKKALLFKRE